MASLYQVFVLTAGDSDTRAIVQATFQCMQEGMWYMQQGLVLFRKRGVSCITFSGDGSRWHVRNDE